MAKMRKKKDAGAQTPSPNGKSEPAITLSNTTSGTVSTEIFNAQEAQRKQLNDMQTRLEQLRQDEAKLKQGDYKVLNAYKSTPRKYPSLADESFQTLPRERDITLFKIYGKTQPQVEALKKAVRDLFPTPKQPLEFREAADRSGDPLLAVIGLEAVVLNAAFRLKREQRRLQQAIAALQQAMSASISGPTQGKDRQTPSQTVAGGEVSTPSTPKVIRPIQPSEKRER